MAAILFWPQCVNSVCKTDLCGTSLAFNNSSISSRGQKDFSCRHRCQTWHSGCWTSKAPSPFKLGSLSNCLKHFLKALWVPVWKAVYQKYIVMHCVWLDILSSYGAKEIHVIIYVVAVLWNYSSVHDDDIKKKNLIVLPVTSIVDDNIHSCFCFLNYDTWPTQMLHLREMSLKL